MNRPRVRSSVWLIHAHPFFTCTPCSVRSPEPMMGAWVKTRIFHPLLAGCLSSTSWNHAICLSSTKTSWEEYSVSRKRTVDSPTHRILCAISVQKLGESLPNVSIQAWRFSASVSNSSIPSRSWFPVTRSKDCPKPRRYFLLSSNTGVVPAIPYAPRSPSDTTCRCAVTSLSSSALICARPSSCSPMSVGSRCKSPRTATQNSSFPAWSLMSFPDMLSARRGRRAAPDGRSIEAVARPPSPAGTRAWRGARNAEAAGTERSRRGRRRDDAARLRGCSDAVMAAAGGRRGVWL
mmetsp:Transcript_63102/g.150594  ORF Transcript_63102/g.150594 Transcript_63102/m.150594 type:complete len:292 (+) Transcript_63102:1109-1984(+)